MQDLNAHSNRNFLVKLGLVIKNYRLKIELTQEEFAAKCGFDRTYISLVERGKRNLSINNLRCIAVNLGIKPSQLLEKCEDYGQ